MNFGTEAKGKHSNGTRRPLKRGTPRWTPTANQGGTAIRTAGQESRKCRDEARTRKERKSMEHAEELVTWMITLAKKEIVSSVAAIISALAWWNAVQCRKELAAQKFYEPRKMAFDASRNFCDIIVEVLLREKHENEMRDSGGRTEEKGTHALAAIITVGNARVPFKRTREDAKLLFKTSKIPNLLKEMDEVAAEINGSPGATTGETLNDFEHKREELNVLFQKYMKARR